MWEGSQHLPYRAHTGTINRKTLPLKIFPFISIPSSLIQVSNNNNAFKRENPFRPRRVFFFQFIKTVQLNKNYSHPQTIIKISDKGRVWRQTGPKEGKGFSFTDVRAGAECGLLSPNHLYRPFSLEMVYSRLPHSDTSPAVILTDLMGVIVVKSLLFGMSW